MERFPTLESLAHSDLTGILKAWEGLGYYARARNIHRAAVYIMKHHGSGIPASQTELLQIPGIGPYIASAIASIAFNIPLGAVDANITRVISRLFGLHGNSTSSGFRTGIRDILASGFHSFAPRWVNQAWMEFGALQCTKRPLCCRCVLQSYCIAFQQNITHLLPEKPQKRTVPTRQGAAFIIQDDRRLFMVQRPDTGLLGGLWELPNVMLDDMSIDDFAAANHLGVSSILPGRIRHEYSHFKLSFRIYGATLDGPWDNPFWQRADWISIVDVQDLPKPGIHIKILKMTGILHG